MKCAILVVLLLLMVGCTDATSSSIRSYGSQFRVTVWGAVGPIKTYTSTGKVEWHEGGGGCEFRDAGTQKHVRISGTVTAEEM